MATNLNALFSQLLEFQWRGNGYPATSITLSLRQDLAVHRYSDRDGAHVEPTGRAPLQFRVRIPFLNSIVPGSIETWGSLYPDAFRQFMTDAADRTRGLMQHPEFGMIFCQLESAEAVWDAEHASSGVFVDATFIESTFTPEQSASTFSSPSPITVSIQSALDLDAELTSFSPPIPDGAGTSLSALFANVMRSVQAIGDQATLLTKEAGGLVDTVAYRVGTIQQSLDTAVTTVTNGHCSTSFKTGALAGLTSNGPACLLWPMRTTTVAMQVSLNDLRKQLLTSGKAIGLYSVPADATLAGICIDLKASLSDLITLNRPLVANPIVPKGTVVRYYS